MTIDEHSSSFFYFQQFKVKKDLKATYKEEYRDNEINGQGTY